MHSSSERHPVCAALGCGEVACVRPSQILHSCQHWKALCLSGRACPVLASADGGDVSELMDSSRSSHRSLPFGAIHDEAPNSMRTCTGPASMAQWAARENTSPTDTVWPPPNFSLGQTSQPTSLEPTHPDMVVDDIAGGSDLVPHSQNDASNSAKLCPLPAATASGNSPRAPSLSSSPASGYGKGMLHEASGLSGLSEVAATSSIRSTSDMWLYAAHVADTAGAPPDGDPRPSDETNQADFDQCFVKRRAAPKPKFDREPDVAG